MKYLKLFKESDKSDYYSILPIGGALEILSDIIDVSDISFNYIKKLFINNKSLISFGYNKVLASNLQGNNKNINISFLKGDIYDTRISIFITELKDEYFIVEIFDGNKSIPKYKCDQIDGVKELLTDLNYI